jgi:putative hydrolase of the HAD superfamily
MDLSLKTSPVQSLVFDLDGTLYVSKEIADEIENTACELVARSRGLSLAAGRSLLKKSRDQLSVLFGAPPTLTKTCMELGIEAAEFHHALVDRVQPEKYLVPDPQLRALLAPLVRHWQLFLYTNNNYQLSLKILTLLGVEDLFNHLYTIEFCWRPKPDPEALQQLMANIGGPPESFLFIGDREHVDLLPPARQGIPTLLVREVSDLLLVYKFLDLA